jgi:hypothetical protein
MAAIDARRFDIGQSVPGVSAFASASAEVPYAGSFMWHFIVSFDAVPHDRDLDADGFHALEFPCRCNEGGCWIDVRTGRLLDIRPTHWREHAPQQFIGLFADRATTKKNPKHFERLGSIPINK